jgi:hypothetical protein
MMINTREKSPDITLQDVAGSREIVTHTSRYLSESIDRSMGSFSDTRRVGVCDESDVEVRSEDIIENLMDDTISDSSLMDDSPLRIMDDELFIDSMYIFLMREIVNKFEDIFLTMTIELEDVSTFGFSFTEFLICSPHMLRSNDT